jgi:hypothetical protein
MGESGSDGVSDSKTFKAFGTKVSTSFFVNWWSVTRVNVHVSNAALSL